MGAHAQEVEVGKSESDERDPRVCAGHPFLIGRLDELAVDMKDGFERLGQKIEDMRVEQAETNSSLKGAWREINASRDKIDEVSGSIEKAIHNHARGCPINDVTEVGIKSDRRKGGDRGRQETYDTPQHLRRSSAPSRNGSSVTMPKWVLWAIILGGVLAIVSIAVVIGVVDANDAAKILPAVTGSGQ